MPILGGMLLCLMMESSKASFNVHILLALKKKLLNMREV